MSEEQFTAFCVVLAAVSLPSVSLLYVVAWELWDLAWESWDVVELFNKGKKEQDQ